MTGGALFRVAFVDCSATRVDAVKWPGVIVSNVLQGAECGPDTITLSKGRRSDLPRVARTRGGKAIAAFARMGRIPCHVLPKPGGPKPGAPEFHINNVNAYHSRLKEWLRPFHGVATKNLPHYLGWRRTLEAFGRIEDPGQWLDAALGSGTYQQVTL